MTTDPSSKSPILEAKDLKKTYKVGNMFDKSTTVDALGGVSFALYPGETLAVVGESGCGKSTLAKVLMGIETPTSGEVYLKGKPKSDYDLQEYRKSVQLIFQDPYSSINPRKKAWEIISEPLAINTNMSKTERKAAAEKLMAQVGLPPENSRRFPHMFSGGQRQRIGIARSMVLSPEILICDEPVSALDLSIQAQILNLLNDLQQDHGLSYIFISHDLSVVKHICDRVMVIYYGKIVEFGTREEVFENPQHEYTKTLLSSVPTIN